MSEENWMTEEELEEAELCEDNEVTPEDCWTGGVFSPGTEQCEFCSWSDICEEEFRKAVGEAQETQQHE